MTGMRQCSSTVILTLVFGLCLAGCLPTSENPIVNRSQSVVDNRLIGSWFGSLEEDDDPIYMHIFRADEDDDVPYPGGMRMILVSHPEGKDEYGDWAVMYGVSARNDDRGVLSLWFEKDSGKPVDEALVGWHLYGYEFNNQGQLQFDRIDEDILIEFIEDGRLQGQVEKTKLFSEVRVTSSSEALVKLFESAEWPSLLSDEPGLFVKQSAALPVFQ